MNPLVAWLILAIASLIGGILLMVLGRGDPALIAAGGGIITMGFFPLAKRITDMQRETQASVKRADEADRKAEDALNTTQTLRRDLLERELKDPKP
ncbi:MAG: hypothetical protein WAT39_03230 [Planctomycetota bacterium]